KPAHEPVEKPRKPSGVSERHSSQQLHSVRGNTTRNRARRKPCGSAPGCASPIFDDIPTAKSGRDRSGRERLARAERRACGLTPARTTRPFMASFSARASLLVMGLLCLLASGCGAGSNLGPVSEAEQRAIQEAAAGSPRLQAGEKIRVNVYG